MSSATDTHNHPQHQDTRALWQLQPKSLRERNKIFADKELLADCHLIVGAEKLKIPAHRYILSVTSWVFYNSFYLLHLNEFQLPDASPDDVRTFLEYFYTDHCTLDKHNVYALLRLAINFQVDHLEQHCIEFIERHLLTIENVIDILQTAHQLNSTELSRKTKQVIEWTILDVMETKSFLNASQSTLELILDMSQLNCSEYQLYQGCMEWATHQIKRKQKPSEKIGNDKQKDNATATSTAAVVAATVPPSPQLKKREVLDKCLYKLRFPTMTTEEFSECAKETELLNADEIRMIFLKIMNKTSTAVTTPTDETHAGENLNNSLLLFSSENRQIKLGFHVSGIWIFNRFIKWSPSSQRQPSSPKHSTLVRVNKPVVIVGLGILMRQNDLSLTDISIQINGRHEKLNEKRTELMYRLELDNGLDIVRVLLDQPVFLETDEVYLIQIVHQNGNLLEIEGQVRDTITNEDLEVTFVKPKKSPYINSIAEVFIHKG